MVLSITDIVLLGIALLFILIYAKRGFLKSLIHSFKLILSLAFAYLFGGRMAEFISENFVFTPVRESVFKKVDSIYQSTAGSVHTDQLTASFPDFILTEDVKAQISAAEGSGEQLVNTITDSIASPVATAISTAIGYVLVFVLSLIGLWIVASILDKILEKITILRVANTILGAVLGLLAFIILMFALGSIIKIFCSDTDFYVDSALLKFFGDSSALQYLKFLDIGNLLR